MRGTRGRRGRRRSVARGFVAGVVVAALTAVGTVAPADASPLAAAARTAAATLAEVRAASAVQDARVAEHTKRPKPDATGTIEPGKKSSLSSKKLRAKVEFSGHQVRSKLAVDVGATAEDALDAARAEQPGGGVPVSDPVDVTATDGSGDEMTRFPAEQVNIRGGGAEGPVVSDVIPGVTIELTPDPELVKANGIDPDTLQIYTREGAGDAWMLLPSYYDADAGVVRGESTHLSQFVVIGKKFVPPPGPVIVLDPDNDEGHAETPAPPVTELGYNIQLAQHVASRLQTACLATVAITRQDPAVPYISRETRAGIIAAAHPTVTLGIGFNTWEGVAWGGEHPEQGGSQVYSRGGAPDNAVSDSLVGNLPTYTGRPAANMGNNGNFPGDEFAGTPNAFTHLEALYIDNNYDRAFIDNGGMPHLADGVFTGLGKYLQSQGFDCTDPVTGGWPAPPSAADLQRWRMLGLQNYLTYGGEPFSFSTGNLVEQEKLFTLPGQGGSETELTLFYNSQDGRLSRVGAGWSFALGARAQRFDDGSVMVVRGDGASFVFRGDGHGGYATTDAGVHQTLSEAGSGRLKLTDVSGESWVFDASDIEGIGNLTSYTDAQGHTMTLSYGAANPDVNQFYPLASITDSAGQRIQVISDAQGRITGFIRPGGDRWTLAYDGAGNLTTITLPDGRRHAFTYDGAHRLLTGTDATGATYLKNEYDSAGRVVKQWDVEGNQRSLDYSTAGQTTYTDNLGRKSVYSFDASHRITKVQHPDGTTASFTYDASNNILSSTDENDAKTAYVYDTSGNITQETASDGAVTLYTYTPTGLVATKTDHGGADGAVRTWAYDYDAAGRLTAIHQPDGTTIAHSYDAAGNLTASTQPSGARTTYAYDAAGHLTSSTDPIGRTTTYAYDAAGRMVWQTDPGGNTTSYSWDSGDRMVKVVDAAGGVFAYGWEPNDHLASATDPTGAMTSYSWDAMFHLTSSTSPTGRVTRYGYTAEDALATTTDPLGAVTANTMDEQDRVVKTTDPNGGEWSYVYDGVGNPISTTSPSGSKTVNVYDAAGNLTSSVDATGAETTYTYDAVGRLLSQTDPDGVTSTYGYDVMDRIASVTDGAGKATTFGYDMDGNLTSVIDRQGNPWTYTYDAAGQVLTVTSPECATTTYGYDADGNLVSTTDAPGRTTTSTYNALDLLASSTDAAGNTTGYTYDGNGRTATVTDANGHTTTYTYDPDGNQATATDALGAVTTYGWDAAANQTSLTDPEGHVTRYGYDPAGQLIQVIEGYQTDAKPSSAVNVTSRYGYDPDGNLTGVTDPNGHITTYTVDAVGRTTREVGPTGVATSWAYTPAGRLSLSTTGTGATTRYAYDERGDLATQKVAGGTASFEYDANQQLIAMTDPTGVSGWVYDKDGRTTTQIDQQGGHLSTSYDAASQVTGMRLPTGQAIDYTYDKAGQVTSQSSPWGSLKYGWDPVGNLTTMSRSSGVTSAFEYDADNRVTSVLHQTPQAPASAPTPTPTPVAYAAGEATADKCATVAGYLADRTTPGAGFNNLCRHTDAYLGDRTLPTPANPVEDGGSLGYAYEYDKDGNLAESTRTITAAPEATGVVTPIPSPTTPDNTFTRLAGIRAATSVSIVDYSYDGLDRLASSTTSAGERNVYGYDAAGNRTGWTRTGSSGGNFTQTATFNDANELTRTTTSGSGRGVSAGIATYGYDGAGNRTTQSVAGVGTQYAYNASGQTASVSRDGRTTSYAYDGLGRQASSTDTTRYGSETTKNTYDGTALTQSTSSTQGTTTLVRDAAGSLASHVSDTGEATWDLLDGLASTIAGGTGASITQLASYDDWGAQTFETTGWDAPENYTGHAQDPTQDLIHTYARTYDPATGTWTTPDTWAGLLTQPKSLARYQYVHNNPTTYLDPDGHICAARNSTDALPLGCGAPPVKARDDVKMPPKPSTPISDPIYGGGYIHAGPNKPQADGPNSKNDESDRHDCPAGQTLYASSYTNSSCVSNDALKQQAANWGTFFDVLGWIGAAAGLLSWIPGMQWLAPIAMIASLASTIYNCINGGVRLTGCVVGILTTVIPGLGGAAGAVLRGRLSAWLSEVIKDAVRALGLSGSIVGVAEGW
ncbi:RHS repeat-associated core domain-containing protein [Leifsonia sp. NPDC080035]|uniref:RHS repeat-associated core domain-containing protein n=1 Tax=Leifsonia sp. NPDC080035 TaxID=3143936 RepID=A0AAU7G9D3_9MICO